MQISVLCINVRISTEQTETADMRHILQNNHRCFQMLIGRVNNIPTMQFFFAISRNTQSKSYTLSLTVRVWELKKIHCGILIYMPYWMAGRKSSEAQKFQGYLIPMHPVKSKQKSLLTLAGCRVKLCDFFCSCFCDVASSIILWRDSIDVGLQVDADFLYNESMSHMG